MNDITKILLYAVGVYVTVITAGVYLAHAEEVPGLPLGPNAKYEANVPQRYVVPRISSTSTPAHIGHHLPCSQYLTICTDSCKHRGGMFDFYCLDPTVQPFQDHFRCRCLDAVENTINLGGYSQAKQ